MAAVQISFAGNLVANRELRFTGTGVAATNLQVAVNDRDQDKTTGEWVDGPADFLDVTVWRRQAENAAKSLRKGDRPHRAVLAQHARRGHPVQRLVGRRVGVDRHAPVCLDEDQPHRARQVCRQPAQVVDGAARQHQSNGSLAWQRGN